MNQFSFDEETRGDFEHTSSTAPTPPALATNAGQDNPTGSTATNGSNYGFTSYPSSSQHQPRPTEPVPHFSQIAPQQHFQSPQPMQAMPHYAPPMYSPFAHYPYGLLPGYMPTNMPTNFTHDQASPGHIRNRPIAPKLSAAPETTRNGPPDFLETVRTIRKQLFDRAGLEDCEEPPEGSVYTAWRKSVINHWKPHSMVHYIMVAKLSKRCFETVLQLAARGGAKVSQSDFLDLYKKTEEQQYTLLQDLLSGRQSFEQLKKQRRKGGREKTDEEAGISRKELTDEIERLRSKNIDLRVKLDQVIEDRDKERERIKTLEEKIRRLEQEKKDEFDQYIRDRNNLMDENNQLNESFTSWSDFGEHGGENSNRDRDRSPLKEHDSIPGREGKKRRRETPSQESSSSEGESDASSSSVVQTGSSEQSDTDKNPKASSSRTVKKGLPTKHKQNVTIDSSSDEVEEEESDSDSDSSTKKQNGPEIITKTVRARKDAKKIRNRMSKQSKRQSEENTKQRASATVNRGKRVKKASSNKDIQTLEAKLFQDKWDYDISKLAVDKWVAVVYEVTGSGSSSDYFVGQVTSITNTGAAQINFLTEKNGVFYWPSTPDRDTVDPKFIFDPAVKITKMGRKFKVDNLEELRNQCNEFAMRYFH